MKKGDEHAKMKKKRLKRIIRKIRIITKTELNAIYRIEAINTRAIPVVIYSFNIIDWEMEGMRKLDRKTTNNLALERMHHPKTDMAGMYFPRNEGGKA